MPDTPDPDRRLALQADEKRAVGSDAASQYLRTLSADPNQAAYYQNQRDAHLRGILEQPLSDARQPTNLGLLNPMPALRALLRGVRDVGVAGGAGLADTVAGQDTTPAMQSPLQQWIDRQLSDGGSNDNKALPAQHYDSLVQSIQSDPHGFLRALGINRGTQ